MTSAREPVLLGLDIGGTKLGVCVGTRDGRILSSARVGADHTVGPEAVLSRCKTELDALLARVGPRPIIAGLGCACPGPFDYATGKFINPPNNPGWHGFDLRSWLAANFSCPCTIMNDANAAALAEWLWGAARGTSTAVFLTMSTGMGSGLIIDGRLYEGPGGLAGEIGQIRLIPGDNGPVGFGKRGSVEGFLSGPGMRQLAVQEAIICRQLQRPSRLRDLFERTGDVTTEQLCQAAREGDAAARRVTDRVALELGRLCAIMTDILNPDVFVVGTIGSVYPDLFLPGALAELVREAIPDSARRVRIVPSGFDPKNRGDAQSLAAATKLAKVGTTTHGAGR